MLKKLIKNLVKAILLALLINNVQLLCIACYNEINGLAHFFSHLCKYNPC